MSRISILKRSTVAAAAALVFAGLLSPANASSRSTALTSHLPWLAPAGHRQPHRADVPQGETLSTWEQRLQQLDQELDRRLIICRGC